MKKRGTGRDERESRADTHRRINEHKKKRFPGSAGYLLIPLTGIIVVVVLFFASRDIFFSDKPPLYQKLSSEPEVNISPDIEVTQAETSLTASAGSLEMSVDSEKTEKASKEAESASGTEKAVIPASGTAQSGEEPVPSPKRSSAEVLKFQKSDLWGVQLAMSTSKTDSERLAEEVRGKGYNPQITRPGEHYRVRVNGGEDRETAVKVEEMLKAEGYDTLLVHSSGIDPIPEEKEMVRAAEFSRYQKNDTWGVQVGMFPDKAGAVRVSEEVRKKGFNPEITKPGKYYRVRVKAGIDAQTAEKINALLKKEGYDTLMVRSSE